VLGDVGQQREVRECADDRDRLADRDAVEHVGQLGAVDLGTPDPEGLHAGTLDEIEDLVTVLLTDGVAEDAAQQPDVFAHRLGGLAADLGALHRANRLETLDHTSQYRRSGTTSHGRVVPRLVARASTGKGIWPFTGVNAASGARYRRDLSLDSRSAGGHHGHDNHHRWF